jgi:hypothetical protein
MTKYRIVKREHKIQTPILPIIDFINWVADKLNIYKIRDFKESYIIQQQNLNGWTQWSILMSIHIPTYFDTLEEAKQGLEEYKIYLEELEKKKAEEAKVYFEDEF